MADYAKIYCVVGSVMEIAGQALAEYGIAPVAVRPVRMTNNVVFEVVTRQPEARYALRVHRPDYRTIGAIRLELEFLAALAGSLRSTRVEVPGPIAARGGEFVVVVAGRCCDLLTWVAGRVHRYGTGLGPAGCVLLGEGLARVHTAAEQFRPPAEFELPRWDADTMFSAASPFDPGPIEAFLPTPARALFDEVAAATREVLIRLDGQPGQRGIIHNDYILGNTLLRRDRNGWRLGILDFDDLGCGYFLYDLAPILGNLFDYPDAYRRLRHRFLDGYRTARPLPAALEDDLPVLMAARHAIMLTWLSAKQRRGESDLPIERHIEVRVAEMARCLALAH